MIKTKRRKILAWRVREEHAKPLTELVRKFLQSLGYKMYETKSKKRKSQEGKI
jgi:hypothetical protein